MVSLGTSKGTSIVIELGIGNLAGLFWNLHNKWRTFSDESTTDTLINELMAANAREKDPAKVLEDMERERREMEERFTIKAGEADKLREQEVLSEYE